MITRRWLGEDPFRIAHIAIKEATAVRAFFQADGSEFYCGDCGWNVDKSTTNLRIETWASWAVSVVGVVLAALALKGPWGAEGALLIAIPFVLLPFVSGLVTRYRLSKIAVEVPFLVGD